MAKKYWVVSPNVKNIEKTVPFWKESSILEQAAFVGWEPDDQKHIMGPKFAGRNEKGEKGIMPGDIILIARRSGGKPDVVGFGMVQGEYQKINELKNFKLPKDETDSGSMRNLKPFVEYREPPSSIPIFDILPPRGAALIQLHPEKYGTEAKYDAHKKVCDWLEQNLDENYGKNRHASPPKLDNQKHSVVIDLPEKHRSGYEYQPKSDLIKADQIEDELFRGYQHWLEKKGHKLQTIEYNWRLQCDGYEEQRRNLIEAKASVSRENIRMAVGQLLDYSFLGNEKFGELNKAILLPKKPNLDLEKWLHHLHISIIWRGGELFHDNANGQFS
jgi:hypothetical protein